MCFFGFWVGSLWRWRQLSLMRDDSVCWMRWRWNALFVWCWWDLMSDWCCDGLICFRSEISILKWASPMCIIFFDLGICVLLVHQMFMIRLEMASEWILLCIPDMSLHIRRWKVVSSVVPGSVPHPLRRLAWSPTTVGTPMTGIPKKQHFVRELHIVLFRYANFRYASPTWLAIRLLASGDVEQNPGPQRKR